VLARANGNFALSLEVSTTNFDLGPVGIHVQTFLLPKDFTCFEMEPELPTVNCLSVVADISYKKTLLSNGHYCDMSRHSTIPRFGHNITRSKKEASHCLGLALDLK
jgi:hypothetical protein